MIVLSLSYQGMTIYLPVTFNCVHSPRHHLNHIYLNFNMHLTSSIDDVRDSQDDVVVPTAGMVALEHNPEEPYKTRATIMNDGNAVVEPAATSNGTTQQMTVSSVLHRSLHYDPLRVISAEGNHLHLSNGQTIFDATGGAAVSCLGHGSKR